MTAPRVGLARNPAERPWIESRLARAARLVILLFVVCASLAPFLCNGRPLLSVIEGRVEFPVLTALRRVDWFWAGLLLALVLLKLLWWRVERRLRDPLSRARARRRCLLGVAGGFALLLVVLLFQDDHLHSPLDSPDSASRSGFSVSPPWAFDDETTDYDAFLAAPSAHHPFGTDRAGRDLLARVLYGSRVSLLVGFGAMSVALAIGILVGLLAGYFGGWIDLVLSRVIEWVMCFPALFLILILTAFLPRGVLTVVLLIGLLGWTTVARLVRGESLHLKHSDFVEAARSLGAGHGWIMWRHILPNARSALLVVATLLIAETILLEASLSFLGLGVEPPTPSWGALLFDGRDCLETAPWVTLFPGAVLFLTITSFNILGESLRDTLDPRWQPREPV